MKLEVMGRVEHRWRLRLQLPTGVAISTATVGLLGEDGRPLGPGMVAPVEPDSTVTVDVRGPCTLPPGTVARVILDVVDEAPITHDLLVAQRKGLHAWLRADSRLPVESHAEFADLSASELRRLSRAWCWLVEDPIPTAEPPGARMAPPPPPEGGAPAEATGREPPSGELRDLLRDCGVDVDDLTGELGDQVRSR